MAEFLDVARNHLASLQDDPDRGPAKHESYINSPLAEEGIQGELTRIDPDASNGAIAGTPIDVSEDNAAAAQETLGEIGVEALAFYKSFRFVDQEPFRGAWGIFLIDAGIEAVTRAYTQDKPHVSIAELRNLALKTLLQHERYHFWIDVWALADEVSQLSRFKRYEYYLEQQRPLQLTESDYEESLANFYAFNALRRERLSDGTTASPLIRRFFNSCPIPYSQFDLSERERVLKERTLAGAVSNGLTTAGAFLVSADEYASNVGVIISRNIRPVPKVYPLTDESLCPVYLVRMPGYAVRVKPFEGPSRGEFLRFLKDYLNGSFSRRTDHEFFRIDNDEEIKIPNPHQNTIRGDEWTNILRKAGLRKVEFRKARKATHNWSKNCPRDPVVKALG